MSTFLLVLLALSGIFLLYTVVLPVLAGTPSFMKVFNLPCPNHLATGRVRLNAMWAALTNAYGAKDLRVARCNLLGKGEVCDQGCLAGMPER